MGQILDTEEISVHFVGCDNGMAITHKKRFKVRDS